MATPSFDSLFSGHAAAYAEFRPRYPAALFAALAERAPARRAAWDCGTGNGQAALGLADHFERVLASDVSAEQLAQATPHPRVTYRQLGREVREAPRDEPRDLADAAFDLVTVAQAVHWFELPRFYATVARVLAPGGVLALWCYSLLEVAPPIDALVRTLHDETLAPDWPPPRALVMNGYRDLALPFPEITAEITAALPCVAIEQELSLAGLLGYLATWSAVQQQRRRTGSDPLAQLAPRLAQAWGDATRARVVRWPLHLRVARKPR